VLRIHHLIFLNIYKKSNSYIYGIILNLIQLNGLLIRIGHMKPKWQINIKYGVNMKMSKMSCIIDTQCIPEMEFKHGLQQILFMNNGVS